MNLFGNALKYTEMGHIAVSLRANEGSRATGVPETVTLMITDTGQGMNADFLANKAFQAFSQENPHATGTGLGLSIVRQIIETSGGKIEISSEPSVGTKIAVKLALSRPTTPPLTTSQHAQMELYSARLKDRKICILQKDVGTAAEGSATSVAAEGLRRFTKTLCDTLEKHLLMHVVQTTKGNDHDADVVIVPELSFEYLASIRTFRVGVNRAPVTIFVAMDALEAATLRSDHRVKSKESVVEIMTQPYVYLASWKIHMAHA